MNVIEELVRRPLADLQKGIRSLSNMTGILFVVDSTGATIEARCFMKDGEHQRLVGVTPYDFRMALAIKSVLVFKEKYEISDDELRSIEWAPLFRIEHPGVPPELWQTIYSPKTS